MDYRICLVVIVYAGLQFLVSSVADSIGSRYIELNRFYGDNLNMPCPTSSVQSTSWKHRPTGNKNFFNVSTGRELSEKYSKYGRFRVLVNEEGGLSNLILSIDSVKLIDVGVFHCSKDQNIQITFKVSVSKIHENLTEAPANSTVLVGHQVQFNCSTSLPVPVYWQHIPVQAGSTNDVYLGKNGLQGEYLRGGRYTIDIQGHGVYNLVISDVQMSDAGTYLCWNDSGLGKKAFAELIVLGDRLSCRLNFSEPRYLDADNITVDPEVTRQSCSVPFHGNIPPSLEWTDDFEPNGLKMQTTYINSSFVISTTMINQSEWLARTSFSCRIGGSSQHDQDYSCTIAHMEALANGFGIDDEVHINSNSHFVLLVSLIAIPLVFVALFLVVVVFRKVTKKSKNHDQANDSLSESGTPTEYIENSASPLKPDESFL